MYPTNKASISPSSNNESILSILSKTGNNSFCQVLCYNHFTADIVNLAQTLINKNYFVNWYLDKLPAALKYYNIEHNITSYDLTSGIPLGYYNENTYYIYNQDLDVKI